MIHMIQGARIAEVLHYGKPRRKGLDLDWIKDGRKESDRGYGTYGNSHESSFLSNS